MLRSENINLRPLEKSDARYFVHWFNDPEVIQYLNKYLPTTEIAAEKRIEELSTSSTEVRFIIEILETDSPIPIGTIGFSDINHKDHNATFNIAIGDKSQWNRGYGKKASLLVIDYGFNQLNLHRITSGIIASNEGSLNLHRSLGFIEEGAARELVYTNGKYHDYIFFGLLKKEWLELRIDNK